MQNLAIICPLNTTKDVYDYANSIQEVVKDKLNFKIFAVCSSVEQDAVNSGNVSIISCNEDSTFDDKIKQSFEYAMEYDATIILDCNNANWLEYFKEMVQKFLDGCDIVYVRKYVKPTNAFKKILNSIKSFFKAIYKAFSSLLFSSADLCVYNSFQLFSKKVVSVICAMPEKNKFLRNFDCWNGFNIEYINTPIKEKGSAVKKFWNKNSIISCVLLLLAVALSISTIFTAKLIKFAFRNTYVSINIFVIVFLLFLSVYFFGKHITNKKIK